MLDYFRIVKRKRKTNKLEKPFKNSGFFKSSFNEHFLYNKGLEFSLVIVKEPPEKK